MRQYVDSSTAPTTSVSFCAGADIDSIMAIHNYALQASPRGLKRKYGALLQQGRNRQDLTRKRVKIARYRLFRQQRK